MIITLIIWVVIFLMAYPYGRLVLRVLARLSKQPIESTHPVFTWLAGVAFLTLLASVFSLVIPISGVVCLGLAAGAVILGVYQQQGSWKRPQWQFQRPSWLQALVILAGVILFIFILDLTSRPPNNPDTAIYHAQAIRWIETYPAVPGLANLHSRLAYNSNWLLANALFSFAWLNLQSFHVLPGLLVLLSLFYFLGGTWQLACHNWSPVAVLKTLFIPFFFIVLPSEVSSPGTDLPVVLITWLILSEYLSLIWQKKSDHPGKQFLLGTLSIFAVTLKLSVLPLLIMPFCFGLTYLWKKKPTWSLQMLVIGMLIGAPWMARNVILSGYLIYPLPQIDIFRVDWKFPPYEAGGEVTTIQNWARHTFNEANQQADALTPQEWIPLWFKKETFNRQIIISLVGIGILIYTLLAFLPPGKKIINQPGDQNYILVYLTSFLGCLYWFLTAPDFRFGYSFMIFSLVLLFFPAFFWPGHWKPDRKKWIAVILINTLVLFQLGFYAASFENKNLSQRWFMPVKYPGAPTNRCEFKNFTVWCGTLYNQCWYEPFPCTPRAIPSVEMRGNSLEAGFRDSSLIQ